MTPLILILIYNLHAVTKPETFPEAPSNTCGIATSVPTFYTPPCTANSNLESCLHCHKCQSCKQWT